MSEVAVVVVAAGRGERAGGGMPKQFRRVGDEIMLRRCLLMLVEAPNVGLVQPVIRPEDRNLFEAAAAHYQATGETNLLNIATREADLDAMIDACHTRKVGMKPKKRHTPVSRTKWRSRAWPDPRK